MQGVLRERRAGGWVAAAGAAKHAGKQAAPVDIEAHLVAPLGTHPGCMAFRLTEWAGGVRAMRDYIGLSR